MKKLPVFMLAACCRRHFRFRSSNVRLCLDDVWSRCRRIVKFMPWPPQSCLNILNKFALC